MNILYIHGFGSSFDEKNPKVQELNTIGTVYGIDIDYTLPMSKNITKLLQTAQEYAIDLVVGTSMGGYFAAELGKYGYCFVAINPAIDPAESLLKYVGTHVDYNQQVYTLLQSEIQKYPTISKDGPGLVLLDLGDEVIDANRTIDELNDHLHVVQFEGGSHRFNHMAESLEHIVEHYNRSAVV